MKSILCSTLCLLMSLTALANTWIGGTGDWNNPANWSTGVVPNSSTQVILQNGKVAIPANYLASAASLLVESTAQLSIEGTLAFQNKFNLNAIENHGKIYNHGLIRIDDYDATSASKGYGVVNYNYFWIGQNASFIAHDLRRSGIRNTSAGYILNMGDSQISVTGEHGIYNQGVLINFYGGDLSIENTGEIGFYNYGNTASFTNYNDLLIFDSGEQGVLCVNGTFTNKSAGDIYIAETGEDGLKNEFGTVTNEGDLMIEQTNLRGIYNNGQFDQEGALIIRYVDDAGIVNDDLFTNTGNIDIRYTGSRGFRNESGTFNNYDYLSIRNVSISGAGITLFEGSITNHSGGHMHIQDVNFVGIQIIGITSAQFTNHGTINIARIDDEGISCSDQFENTGQITINVCTNGGGFSIGSTGSVNNSGTIEINEVDHGGLVINSGGQFHNEDEGVLEISDTGFSGLFIQPNGTFVNDNSLVSITTPIGLDHIRNTGDFENINCGVLTVDGRISNQPGATILNEAWISISFSGINSNSGSFINNGGMGDQFGSLNFTTIQNNSVIAKPLTGTVQAGVNYPNAMDVGSFAFVKVLGWFVDANATVSAGKYDSSNTFRPNNNAVGLNTLYVQMFNLQEECIYVVPIDIPGGVAPLTAPHQNGIDIAENNEVPTFSVFPNPSNGDIQIKGGTISSGDYQIRLLDAQGKIQYQTAVSISANEAQHLRLPNHLPRGLYLLQLGNNQEVVSNHRLLLQ